MNILIINHYAGSEEMGMEYRPYYLAREWVKYGHSVTILTSSFSHLRITNPHINKNFQISFIDGVKYIYIKTNQYSNNDIERVKNIFDFLYKAYFNMQKIHDNQKFNIIIASSTYPFDIVLANKFKKNTEAKVIFELHDIWPLSLIELYGYNKNNPLMQLVKFYEEKALKKSDLVVSLLPNITQYFKDENIKVKNCIHIPNGISISENTKTKLPVKHLEFIKKHKLNGKFIVMYCGGFSMANHLDYFVNAASAVDKNTIFIAIGNGPSKMHLKYYIQKMDIDNMFFLNSVTKKELPQLMNLADCLYLGAKKSILYQYGISMNKIYDYMLAGKPIICAINALKNPIELANCGIIIEPDDSLEVAKAVETIKNMTKKQRESMGQLGKEYVIEYHNYEKLAKEYLNYIENLI